MSSLDFTIEGCLNWCIKEGFRYAGLQEGIHCLCACLKPAFGNVTNDKCGIPCRGDFTLKCGGSAAVQTYEGTFFRNDLVF